MKKGIVFFAALFAGMTLMWRSALCYAAAPTGTEETGNMERSINTQYGSVQKDVTLSGTGIVMEIELSFAWDEGYTGWFEDARLVGVGVPEDSPVVVLKNFGFETHGSYIDVTVDLYYGDDFAAKYGVTFYVDEYGEVS